MILFILRRLVAGLILVWAIATLTFFLLAVGTSGVDRRLAGQQATPEQVAAVAESLGLNRSVWVRYIEWLGNAVRGDFGTSWFTNQPVTTTIGHALPVSLSLVISATVLTAAVAIALGVLAAVRGGWVDRCVQAVSTIAFAVPNFIVAVILALVFAVSLALFPAVGFVPISAGIGPWLTSITLPAIALAVGAVGSAAAQTRGSMIDVMKQDYIRTLRSRGVPVRSLLLVHALRNAAPAALTVLGIGFVATLGGSVVIEKVFGLKGIGASLTSASTQGDLPVVLGFVIVTVVVVVIVNLLVDLALGWLNPKARIS